MSGTDKPKILIVDDIEVNLILLETILRKEQAEIYKALNGKSALEITAVHDFALIIMDVSMPGMSGYELAEHIRNQEKNKLTPIIFVSAMFFDEQSISRGYKAGAVDYLTKPFQNEVLLSKVRVFLKLFVQNRELFLKSQALNESLTKHQKAEQTILFKYQLERAVSLASARFSGNFDADSSIEFMLMDMARICDASAAFFIGFDQSLKHITISDKLKSNTKPEIPGENQLKNIREAFSKNKEGCSVLTSLTGMDGPWTQPQNNLSQNSASVCIAIPVQIADSVSGSIILSACSGLTTWEKQDICALGVFSTIAGNALERIKTTIELEKSESKYRSYIENAPEGILVTESNGTIAEANPTAFSMFGKTSGKLISSDINQLLKQENLAGSFPDYSGLTHAKQCLAEFFVSVGKTSRIIRAGSVKLPDGRFLIFCTDITAAREMEKHLIHTERLVGIGEMATGIAHEINQPLNTISFGIDNLLHAMENDKADGEYVKEKARKIFEGIHRMRSIIDHVRTFSRSNDDYILSAFNLNETIENALSLVREQFNNREITLITELEPDSLVQVHGNTFKIEQVLLNLLSNSRDAIEEKQKLMEGEFKASINLTTRRAGDNVILSVKDNGNGIAPEHLDHITTPFYTTKEPGKGTGLGLAISYGIIKEHKGNLSFRSNPGAGTTVEIELPAMDKKIK